MIGYPVSGHPLDGMSDFIRARSKNLGPIFEWMASLDEVVVAPIVSSVSVSEECEPSDPLEPRESLTDNDVPPPPELPPIEEEKEESIYAQLI